jgi:hypothetical protein
MSSVRSANNYTLQPLGVGNIYVGSFDSVLKYSSAIISCIADTTAEIIIYSSIDKTTLTTETYQVVPNEPFTQILQLSRPFMYATLRNTSASVQTLLNFEIIYREVSLATSFPVPQQVEVTNFPATQGVTGTVSVSNFPATQGVTGAVSVSNFPATQGVTGSVSVSNFPATQEVTGTVAISSLPDLSGLPVNISGQTVNISNQTVDISNQTVDISNQTVDISGQAVVVSGNVTIPHLNYDDDSILDSGVYKPTDDGINSYFEITASPVNNVVAYYADETKGVDAVGGGWEFTSSLHSSGTKRTKINWYMFQPTTSVVIGDLTTDPKDTYYTIITNVGIEFPLIYIYTRPTVPATKITGGLGGSSWYQSKFVFQATQAGTNTGQQCLLYVGKDPTTILPLIPHIRLSQLNSLCQGTLQTNEIVMSASLQTSSALVSPNGNFSLTMFKFGVIIDPVNTPLKVDANGALNVVVSNPAAIQVNSNTRDGSGNSITSTSSALDVNIKTNPVIVKDKPTSSVSLHEVVEVSQEIRNSPGCLNSFYITNIGGAQPSYVKFYNAATAVANDVPLMTIVLHKDTQVYINASNMNFSSALCVRAVDDFSNASNIPPPGTVSITCFLSDYSI